MKLKSKKELTPELVEHLSFEIGSYFKEVFMQIILLSSQAYETSMMLQGINPNKSFAEPAVSIKKNPKSSKKRKK